MISNYFLNHLKNHIWVRIKTISFMYLLFIWRLEIYLCEVPTKSNLLLGKQNTSILITAVFIVIEYKYLCLKNILENYNTDKRKIFVNCRNFSLSWPKSGKTERQIKYYYSVFFCIFFIMKKPLHKVY